MTDDEIIEWAVANGIEFHTVKQQVRVGVHALAGTDSMPALRLLCAMAAAKERTARQAAQVEVVELKERIARAGVEQRSALIKAVLQEREACAKVAERMSRLTAAAMRMEIQDACAAAIRSRQ